VTASPRRSFGATWWGRAWVEALEHRARLDPNRLPRGRTYARHGRVGLLTVEPGAVRAAVSGSRAKPYIVHVRVRQLTDAEWDLVLDAIAARAAHTAALLDGELPPEVVADAVSAGVELLPVAGEVGPRCSCPDWADPCKHSAAVVYLMAEVLDNDQFALLLLRGRSREAVLSGLRQRRARGAAGPRPAVVTVDGGVVARDAYARQPAALPLVPLPPRAPGAPVPLAVDPPPSSGVSGTDLVALAADAAARAWDWCVGEGDGGLGLDPALDAVRRAAAVTAGPGGFGEMARRVGVRPTELGRQVAAWRAGGADGLRVLDETWSPDADALDEGRAAISPLGSVRVRANRVGAGDVELRLGRGGCWYRFERAGRRWELAAGPSADPASLVPPG
jgi:uncharacterized Zn finger protein